MSTALIRLTEHILVARKGHKGLVRTDSFNPSTDTWFSHISKTASWLYRTNNVRQAIQFIIAQKQKKSQSITPVLLTTCNRRCGEIELSMIIVDVYGKFDSDDNFIGKITLGSGKARQMSVEIDDEDWKISPLKTVALPVVVSQTKTVVKKQSPVLIPVVVRRHIATIVNMPRTNGNLRIVSR